MVASRRWDFSIAWGPPAITRLDRKCSFEGGVTTLGSDKDDNGTAIWPLSDGSLLISPDL
jgi:hypothetical protein